MTCPSYQFYQEDEETSVGEEYGEEGDGWGYWDPSPLLSISILPWFEQTFYLACPQP